MKRATTLVGAATLCFAGGCGTGLVGEVVELGAVDRLGVVRGDTWQLDTSANGRWDGCAVDLCFPLGTPTQVPLGGDWEGNGWASPAVYDRATALFSLFPRQGERRLPLGEPGDLPLAGDWDGDGLDTVAVFSPRRGQFTLRLDHQPAGRSATVSFGAPGDLPLSGDWDGDGRDTLGVYRQSEGLFILVDQLGDEQQVVAGGPGDLPLSGDWDGDGIDTVGLYDRETGSFVLTDPHGGTAEQVVIFAEPGRPVVGRWRPRGA